VLADSPLYCLCCKGKFGGDLDGAGARNLGDHGHASEQINRQGKGGAVLINPPLQTHEARCPHCHGKMKLIRHITLADLPDLYVFYCSHCQHVETVKEELIAA
jgi:hypothetical protein